MKKISNGVMNIFPTKKDFIKLAKKANVIPVYKEILADLETPVSSFLKIEEGTYSYLLESVEGQEKIARFSFLSTRPTLIFKSKDRVVEITEENKTKKFITDSDPLEEIKKIISRYKFAHLQALPRFCGGFVGYIGYDMVRFFERVPDKNPDDLDLPDMIFMLSNNVVVFDHVNHKIKIISNVILPKNVKNLDSYYNKAVKNIEYLEKKLKTSIKIKERAKRGKSSQKIESNFSYTNFKKIVKKAKEYIRHGDIIQVVLSQRFKVKTNTDAFSLYRNLRSLNPSPYMYFLKFKETILIGSSPELLLRCEDNVVSTRPIAGTRPRGKNELEDQVLKKELLNDKKEKAEHLMLVDLGRNDLGRVSKFGSVKLTEFMNVENYSHVMHIVSEVQGLLRRGKDSFDALRAAFPAGTVSGSPKIRAMEIIDELENIKRGPYAGAVGYFDFSGNLDTCITIRTIVMKKNIAYVQAGAGIVADSDPKREYFETVNKAKALIETIKKS